MRLYNAEISAGSLLVAESRRIAVLMLGKPTDAEWESAIKEENILQKTPATARRQAQLLRNRLSTLDDAGLIMVAEESSELCRQILMAAAMRHSRLMSDFMRDVYIDDLRRLERTLSHRQWDEFLLECEHRDDAVRGWSETTRKKLFQVIVRILGEAGYLDSTRKLGLTPPMLHPRTKSYLQRLGDGETLARMEISR
jgi:hypothetical protein